MSAYSSVRVSKLKLKSNSSSADASTAKKEKKKKRKPVTIDEDAVKHGGWWQVTEYTQINGPVAIEVFPYSYVRAHDDGSFTFGAPHPEGSGPDPEEILTAVRLDSKIAMKSGYGKYLGVTPTGKVVGVAEAIGALEQWEPVFKEGKLALAGSNQCFLTCKNEDQLMANSSSAGLDEIIKIRSNSERNTKKKDDEEEETDFSKTELHYVKQFQCFQDKKIKLNPGSLAQLDSAKKEGSLHETMLDRREKMKSDRMCK